MELIPKLLPRLLEEIASEEPDATYAEFLPTDWQTKGTKIYNFAQVAQAVNNVCFWLDKQLGNVKTFAYHGPNDARYTFLLIAAIKTQRRIVLPDGRLTDQAKVSLLEQANCQHWIGASSCIEDAEALINVGVTLHFIPSLSFWLQKGEVYPFNKTFDEVKDEIVWILHTSGTTGTPKLIAHTNGWISTWNIHHKTDHEWVNQEINTFKVVEARSFWLPPPQWLGGIAGYVIFPLFSRSTPVLPCAPMSPSDIDEMIQNIGLNGAFLLPAIILALCKQPDSLERLRKLDFIIYAGSPLEKWVGDSLCEYTELIPVIGSTEVGILYQSFVEDPKDWSYYRFAPETGVEFDLINEGEAAAKYELIVRKSEHVRWQGIFQYHRDSDVWRTNDLYEKHPSRDGLFRYVGRKDDLFKTDTHDRIQARDIESALERSPLIQGCIMGGSAKPEPFLLVESTEASIDDIWELVEQVNQKNVVKIQKEKIIMLDRPLSRSAKGTVDRIRNLEEYRALVDALYA